MSQCSPILSDGSLALALLAADQYTENWVENMPALPDMPSLNAAKGTLLDEAAWSEIAIVSSVTLVSDTEEPPAKVMLASGERCARCWRVLPEVGSNAAHPSLCLRCVDAGESGLVSRAAP
jgi:isoleucyl-tRNA synthetase